MIVSSRRGFLGLGLSMLAVGGCANGVGSDGAAQIDARVDATQAFLFDTYPGTRELNDSAAGVLWMPLITEAGLFVGGAYGRGALRINGATVDYYAVARASYGFQAGAQQYAHALFFMTGQTLQDFRSGAGWSVAADAFYATPEDAGSIGKESVELDPVVALVFGQSGLIAGVSLEGAKYTRIIP